MASAVTIVVLPVLIVYLFLQKNIVKGLTAVHKRLEFRNLKGNEKSISKYYWMIGSHH